jgi:UrcA family protein
MTKIGLLITAIAFGSGPLAQPGYADPALRTERISYAGLNLASPRDQAALRHRIKVAAARLCDLAGLAYMEDYLESAACYRQALADGMRQMQQLVAAYESGGAVAAAALVIAKPRRLMQ